MFKPKRRFQFEQLEPRQMMAGDITAVLTGGSLYLTEAAGQAGRDNGVLVSELANGKVHVQGTAITGAASKINGHASQDFTVTGSLFVNFGAGNDRVEFSALGPVLKLQTIDLNLGPPSVKAGVSDNDVVTLANFQTTGGLSIYTGAGDDQVNLNGGVVGNYAPSDQLWIKTGAGADYVSIQGTQIHGNLLLQTYDALTENSTDVVYFDKAGLVAGNTTILLGSGADKVFIGDVAGTQGYVYSFRMLHSLTLDTGAGDDTIFIYSADIGADLTDQTIIRTGAGRDHVTIDGMDGSGTSMVNLDMQTYTLLSEADADVVQIQNATFEGNASIKMGGGDDLFLVTDPGGSNLPAVGINAAGNLLVDTGAGNDVVFMRTIAMIGPYQNQLTIHTGAGADTVNLYNSHQLRSVEIQTYDSLSENDADVVNINDVFCLIDGGLVVRLGGGDDQLNLTGVVAYGTILLDAGDGNDTVTLQGANTTGIFFVNMGAGNDTLTLDHIQAFSLDLLGGDGYDRLNTTDNIRSANLTEIGWESFNHWRLW